MCRMGLPRASSSIRLRERLVAQRIHRCGLLFRILIAVPEPEIFAGAAREQHLPVGTHSLALRMHIHPAAGFKCIREIGKAYLYFAL